MIEENNNEFFLKNYSFYLILSLFLLTQTLPFIDESKKIRLETQNIFDLMWTAGAESGHKHLQSLSEEGYYVWGRILANFDNLSAFSVILWFQRPQYIRKKVLLNSEQNQTVYVYSKLAQEIESVADTLLKFLCQRHKDIFGWHIRAKLGVLTRYGGLLIAYFTNNCILFSSLSVLNGILYKAVQRINGSRERLTIKTSYTRGFDS